MQHELSISRKYRGEDKEEANQLEDQVERYEANICAFETYIHGRELREDW